MKKIITLSLITLFTIPAFAGTLTPPGAPAPTMKTLDEVEARTPIHTADLPLVISQSGSYYLAEDIHLTTGTFGIAVSATNVTIDLNGFTLKGPGPSQISVNGITSGLFTTGTVIKNGTITEWSGNGIFVGTQSNIENVCSLNNNQNGIVLSTGNVANCTAAYNSLIGIIFANDSNPGMCSVSGCKVTSNNSFGIFLTKATLAHNNMCSDNNSIGIYTDSPYCIIKDNICAGNSVGISIATTDCAIANNNCSGNNTGIGVFDGNNRVIGNNCHDNINHGINVSASNCHVESNNSCDNGAKGFIVFSDSIAIKNTAADNTVNFDFQVGSVHGPTVDMTPGGIILNTNPWANFEY